METLEYLKFLAALALIVGLILGIAWVSRRFGLAPKITGANGRLGVVAIQSLDTRRKLVLVRRDDREHLLLLGPTGETVVETGIVPPDATASAPTATASGNGVTGGGA